MALTLRSTKGSKLTISEMDNNLVYLDSFGLVNLPTSVDVRKEDRVGINSNGEIVLSREQSIKENNITTQIEKNGKFSNYWDSTAEKGVISVVYSDALEIYSYVYTIDEDLNVIIDMNTETLIANGDSEDSDFAGNMSFHYLLNTRQFVYMWNAYDNDTELYSKRYKIGSFDLSGNLIIGDEKILIDDMACNINMVEIGTGYTLLTYTDNSTEVPYKIYAQIAQLSNGTFIIGDAYDMGLSDGTPGYTRIYDMVKVGNKVIFTYVDENRISKTSVISYNIPTLEITSVDTTTLIEATYASFSGTVGSITEPIELRADNPGVIGNDIVFIGGEIAASLSALINQWNINNPTNTVSVISGDPNQVLQETTLALSGGADDGYSTYTTICYDNINNKLVFMYFNDADDLMTKIATLDGATITYETPTTLATAIYNYLIAPLYKDNKIYITYCNIDTGRRTNIYELYLSVCHISGTELIEDNNILIGTFATNGKAIPIPIDTPLAETNGIISIRHLNAYDDSFSITYNNATEKTNNYTFIKLAIDGTYIGISTNNYLAGQTATIRFAGEMTFENETFTPGETISYGSVDIGKAISINKALLYL
jgi:hypothetical protein